MKDFYYCSRCLQSLNWLRYSMGRSVYILYLSSIRNPSYLLFKNLRHFSDSSVNFLTVISSWGQQSFLCLFMIGYLHSLQSIVSCLLHKGVPHSHLSQLYINIPLILLHTPFLPYYIIVSYLLASVFSLSSYISCGRTFHGILSVLYPTVSFVCFASIISGVTLASPFLQHFVIGQI